MTAFKRLAFVMVTLMLAVQSQAKDFYLEAANSRGHPHLVKRSNASTGVTVRLEAGESIQLTFCLKQTTVIQVGVPPPVWLSVRQISVSIC